MASTPASNKTNTSTLTPSTRLTPSNSSNSLSTVSRVQKKVRRQCAHYLSLKNIIGTTVTNSLGFSCDALSRKVAYVAGTSAVVLSAQDGYRQQEVYRARPAYAAPTTIYGSPSLAQGTAKTRTHRSIRESENGQGLSTPASSNSGGQSDSPASKNWSSREKIKPVTCLSLSPGGQYLAVGEVGYEPRILIYNLRTSIDKPVSIGQEHKAGVFAIKFSPSGKYLATLGDVSRDGFLHIWAVDQRTGGIRLHSSNKCITVVKDLAWTSESTLITVGVRHVKSWSLEESAAPPSPSKQKPNQESFFSTVPSQLSVKTLFGRNIILKTLMDETFTCVLSISTSSAIICTEKGDVALVGPQHDQGGQKLIKIGKMDSAILCGCINPKTSSVWLVDASGEGKTFDLPQDLESVGVEGVNLSLVSWPRDRISTAMAISWIDDTLIVIDKDGTISHCNESDKPGELVQSETFTTHSDPVLGIGTIVPQLNGGTEMTFFTWSACGKIILWDTSGRALQSLKVLLEENESGEVNQCLVVKYDAKCQAFIAGDKFGMLNQIDLATKKCSFRAVAHSLELLDIAIWLGNEQSGDIMATSSRDRTLQVFHRFRTWNLAQTLEHAANVSSLKFGHKGNTLLAACADRTIHVRQVSLRLSSGIPVVVLSPLRVITCRATPLIIRLAEGDNTDDDFMVSMSDKTVATYRASTGKVISSFKTTADNTDAVVLHTIDCALAESSASSLLVGASAADKSIRLYDAETGVLLDKEWGHSATITDVALLPLNQDGNASSLIVSTGSEGIIILWDVLQQASNISEDNLSLHGEDLKPQVIGRSPLRKVLTKQEIAAAQGTPIRPRLNRPFSETPTKALRQKPSGYVVSTTSTPKLETPIVSTDADEYFADMTISDAPPESSAERQSRSPQSPSRQSVRSEENNASECNTSATQESVAFELSTEQICQALRVFRQKLQTGSFRLQENTQDMDELENELKLTSLALKGDAISGSSPNELISPDLLHKYSEQLVGIFDERLKHVLSYLGAPRKALDGVENQSGRTV